MAERRIGYLAALIGCVVFFWAYREWLSWILLMLVVFLPWFSLLVSLPAMLKTGVAVRCPETISLGDRAEVSYVGDCALPTPPIRGKLLIQRPLTGEQCVARNESPLPTEHCGALLITPKRIWVYDYLGLLRLPVRKKQAFTALVRPVPVQEENPPDMSRYLVNAWKPKPGGGFAENHELRLYRPGDNLRQLHWKLSAKTGKLILREPMEALRGLALLTLELTGTPKELDRKLGKLQWLSQYLLSKDVPHQVHCLTGSGMETFQVKNEGDVLAMIDTLLRTPAAAEDMRPSYIHASWSYHIGGDSHEA